MAPSTGPPVDDSPSTASNDFQALRSICVPLLSNSLLTSETIPRVSRLLSQLASFLRALPRPEETLSPSTISYIFFPLSHILQRNPVSLIPDVVMESFMDVLAVLFEQWWWSCPVEVWEQVLMLSGALLSGMDSSSNSKGKRQDRDDEAKRAAAQCLWSVLRRRSEADEVPLSDSHSSIRMEERFIEFQKCGREAKLLPILGQTLTSLLDSSQSAHRGLGTLSLRLIYALITEYLPDAFMPSVLPGVTSAMVKVALGRQEGRGWSSGDIVDLALAVMRETIIRAIGDQVCEAEGVIRVVSRLEDLEHVLDADEVRRSGPSSSQTSASPYFIPRTSVWLAASVSQLHIALNTLSPLMSHPNPMALHSLSQFSHAVLSNTTRTLLDSQPLLLSFLLSLSTNHFPNVAKISHDHLLNLLMSPSPTRVSLLQIVLRITRDNISTIPRLLPSHNDAKVEHLAHQVSAVCKLASHLHAVADGVGKLLGPTGGIEKWGWSLLSVFELDIPPLFVSAVHPQALLESGSTSWHPFPEVNMKYVTSSTARDALQHMFRTMGAAGRADCLFAVEWFIGVARRGRASREVAALWCAREILEGVSVNFSNSSEALQEPVPKRIEKTARWVAKVVAELWEQDQEDQEHGHNTPTADLETQENDSLLPLEYVKGLDPLTTRFDLGRERKQAPSSPKVQQLLHKTLSLQLLSVTSTILQTQFIRLLLYTMYPILHSLVSENSYLSSTALAALHQITSSTAYASPSNLLLANFDYALDAVARRLDRRQLDPDAARILVVLVRLVGKDVVSRAGDVVEACFDRLDEFHGYSVLVEGLVEVLAEVVTIVEADHEPASVTPMETHKSQDQIGAFLDWYQHRHDAPTEHREEYGPAPREAWGEGVAKGKAKEVAEEDNTPLKPAENQEEPPPTLTRALTQQIVSRSIYFLTHSSPLIRARILSLLDAACPTLSESNLLPSIHQAWPYVLNRLSDSEPFVVTAAASLISSLAEHVGEFMTMRIWNDIWPRFRTMLSKLEDADSESALARRGRGAVGTESAYSNSHRLYKSLLRTMCAVAKGVQLKNDILWEVLLAFRRFLHVGAHEELQLRARELFIALAKENADAVWLMLTASMGKDSMGVNNAYAATLSFLKVEKWDMERNANQILDVI